MIRILAYAIGFLAASYPGAFSLNPVLYIQISDKHSERARGLGEALSLICTYNTGLSDNAPGYKAGFLVHCVSHDFKHVTN